MIKLHENEPELVNEPDENDETDDIDENVPQNNKPIDSQSQIIESMISTSESKSTTTTTLTTTTSTSTSRSIGSLQALGTNFDGDINSQLVLVSDVMPEPIEQAVAAALDELCPELTTTPKLQDKALRCVFSVGIDVVIVDSLLSVAMGKFNLKPTHLLTSDDTDDIFGEFLVPKPMKP